MRLSHFLLSRRRLIGMVATLLGLFGLAAFLTMPREEDPRLPPRLGTIVAPLPGADPDTVARLVAEPIEDELAEVEGIKAVRSVIRSDACVFTLELTETVYDTDLVWDRIQRAIDDARLALPDSALEPVLNRDIVPDQEAVVLAITGSDDVLVLADAADRLEERLLRAPGVRKVKQYGDPEEQIVVTLDDAIARRLGVSAGDVAGMLRARNDIVPGGSIRSAAGRTVVVAPQTEFRSLDEIRATPVVLPSGTSIRLDDVATVARQPTEPSPAIVRFNGRPAVGLSVIQREGLNVVTFGTTLREVIDELRADVAPLQIETVSFQPDYVQNRLTGLGESLLLGMGIVAVVLMLVLGLRVGAVASFVIPVVAAATIGVYALTGGVLHQISIAALVIALGLLVDNAIVMAERVKFHVDAGLAKPQAATTAVRELAMPLAASTGTTIAAFIPMLFSSGNTADFTRSISIVISLSLLLSLGFALLVTPNLGAIVFSARKGSARQDPLQRLGRGVGGLAVRRRTAVLITAALLVLFAGALVPLVSMQFFPYADRNQMLVEVELPDGTHVARTDALARELETILRKRDDVSSVATFVGRSAPRFYYNLVDTPNAPQFAQLLVTTNRDADVDVVQRAVWELARERWPDATILPQRLQQGPPVRAPIELRLYGADPHAMQQAASALTAVLRNNPNAVDVRSDVGIGVPTLAVEVDDAVAARWQLARLNVAESVFGRTRGLPAGEYRQGEDPIPVVVRSPEGERLSAEALASVELATMVDQWDGAGMQPTRVPLSHVAEIDLEFRPAVVRRRNGLRHVTVLADLAPGKTYSMVIADVDAALARGADGGLVLPDGVRLEVGGEAESSSTANGAILMLMPVAMTVLIGILLAEFNSFRRVGLILMTVPLAAVGVIPGMVLTNQPFGFMSMLGVISLVGIVVNNAIVLIDLIEQLRGAGRTRDDAIREAVAQRTRPILLTSITTIAGVMPLALSGTQLWPPMAWALISGLAASTVLTIAVVPAMYGVLFRERGPTVERGDAPVVVAEGLAAD